MRAIGPIDETTGRLGWLTPGVTCRGLTPGGGVLWDRGGPADGGEHTVIRRKEISASSSARAVASEGPYQVSRRPGRSTTRRPGNSSGPSAAVKR